MYRLENQDKLVGAFTVGSDSSSAKPFITLINLKTGNDEWTAKLPAQSIKGGASIDSAGRILVT
jgi:hypothetical protein